MKRKNQISRRNFLSKLSAGTVGIAASGIVAHQSALKNGEQLVIPDFDKK